MSDYISGFCNIFWDQDSPENQLIFSLVFTDFCWNCRSFQIGAEIRNSVCLEKISEQI